MSILVRRIVAYLLGLALPLAAFVGVVHLASERVGAAHLHVERVSEPVATLRILTVADLGDVPGPVMEALVVAAHEGGADIPMSGPVRAAWEQIAELAGDDDRAVVQFADVLLLVEARMRLGPVGAALEVVGDVGGYVEKGAASIWRKVAG